MTYRLNPPPPKPTASCSIGCFGIIVAIVLNLLLLGAAVWVVVWVLQQMGVL